MKALSVRQLRKVYTNGTVALKGIDLDVAEGDFFALLGQNGAGKSTTIGIISSLVRKTEGQVSVLGHDLDNEPSIVKSLIGVMPQEVNFSLFDKVSDILLCQAGYYGIPRSQAYERMERYLNEMGLWQQREHPAIQLSGGMKRRLMVARALMNHPRLLILDEPTAGVDVELRQQLWRYVRDLNARGVTVLLTTHYLEEAEQLCDRIAIINHGKVIACDTTAALLRRLDAKELSIIVDHDLTGVPASLGAFDAVLADSRRLVVRYQPSRVRVAEILAAVHAAGLEIVDLSTLEADLEDIFLQLTRADTR